MTAACLFVFWELLQAKPLLAFQLARLQRASQSLVHYSLLLLSSCFCKNSPSELKPKPSSPCSIHRVMFLSPLVEVEILTKGCELLENSTSVWQAFMVFYGAGAHDL